MRDISLVPAEQLSKMGSVAKVLHKKRGTTAMQDEGRLLKNPCEGHMKRKPMLRLVFFYYAVSISDCIA
jgi:hypothetical protein